MGCTKQINACPPLRSGCADISTFELTVVPKHNSFQLCFNIGSCLNLLLRSLRAPCSCLQDELDAERLQEVDQLTPEGIARLVKAYHNNNGSSGDETFDKRVRVTLAGIDKAIEWIISKADGI